jgi:hypothetical protein
MTKRDVPTPHHKPFANARVRFLLIASQALFSKKIAYLPHKNARTADKPRSLRIGSI